ncbi:YdcF family protein [Cohnella fermenti]|uniref:YdcF family protein n=1 Tax=Cohnella fermenti TaxID=2565925 RepID=A0A4S4BH07_9BACL|nr:YdcF family protein [Cohnella fermenti]THF73780.1 YdcF family protein [Cohnella fermenti]
MSVYLIKFVYSFVLPPGGFLVLLLLLAVRLRRQARRGALGLFALTLLFYASSTPLVSNVLVGALEGTYGQPSDPQGDVIVVLGGGATRTTPDLNGQGNLSGSAANRLLAAARLHLTTGLPILFSGGQVYAESGNEADIARRQLMELGIREDAILVENRSLNTEQNAEYTAELLEEKGLSHPILITSAIHMPRASHEFRHVGLDVLPYPVDYRVNDTRSFSLSMLLPGAEAFAATGSALKEYLGLLAANLFR